MSGLRFAFARINQETNALSPVPTTLHDFERDHLKRGTELLASCRKTGEEIDGFLKNAECSGFVQHLEREDDVELVPLLSAWAIPSGPLTTKCFDTLAGEIVDGLRVAGRVDGLYLCLHGAMGVDGITSPEAELVGRIRAHVAPDVPIVVSLDLHANLTEELVARTTAIVAYGTNPHRDYMRVGRLCGSILSRTARGEIKPVQAWRSLPMLLGGGTTIDFLSPMRSIFRRMRALEKSGDVLSASVLTCHPWNNNPALGWSTLVVTDANAEAANHYAEELAETCWKIRHIPPPKFPTPGEALARVKAARLRRRFGAAIWSDASDVVTAGAPGENTALLEVLLRDGAGLRAYVPIRSPRAVAELWQRNVGEEVSTEVGGELDPASPRALPVKGTLLRKTTGVGVERMVVLGIGELRLVIVEGAAAAIRPSFYRTAGLSLWKADIMIVKNFFTFMLFFFPYARLFDFVKTRGVTDLDAAFRLTFDGPMHPRDPIDDWRERDALRRTRPERAPITSEARPLPLVGAPADTA